MLPEVALANASEPTVEPATPNVGVDVAPHTFAAVEFRICPAEDTVLGHVDVDHGALALEFCCAIGATARTAGARHA